jgi:hypothetical protein
MAVDPFARQTGAKTADLASSTAGKGGGMIGYAAPGFGAAARTAKAVLDATVRADDYTSVQQAADFAASETVGSQSRRSRLDFQAQNYVITAPLVHYEGQAWVGHGNAETTNRLNTKIAPSADNIDAITLSGHPYSAVNWHFGLFENFMVMGRGATSTSGWGMNWSDGTNNLRPQGQTTVRRITIRNMASGGIRFANGGLETVVSDVKIIDCGGPGVYFKGVVDGQQSFVFQRIAADHCEESGLFLDTLQLGGHVSVRDFKSEAGVNTAFGDGVTANQLNAIVVNNPVAGAGLTVDGMTHISSGSSTTKPGDAIAVLGTNTPDLSWKNVQVRVLGSQTVGPNPNVVAAPSLGVAIPAAYPSGKLSNLSEIWRTTLDAVHYVFGRVDTYQNRTNEGPAEQIAGGIPGRSLHNTSASANEKTWLEVVNGNRLSRRAVDDSGTATIFEQISRTGNAISAEEHRRIIQTLGTTHVAGDFGLAAGWGTTATRTINGGSKDSRFDISVTCGGTGITANPAITLTYKDGAFAQAPIGVVNGWNDTDSTGIALKWSEGTSTMSITFLGTPVAGKTYRIKGVLL